ncbi:uncharacterized protein K02A2.6-like [Strongylocentrotus purpuratus]|uniref:Endonuclease n=1 Tax=Strongylocentrotus purpuratus TaxID=7668 RepID=A0A7M7HJP2_STRPU|nr:uncharacterized protein K02A2.6-like [Strongylocentrotus purpuratus]
MPDERSDSSDVASNVFKRPNINPPAHLRVSDGDAIEGWKMWKQMWDNYCVLTNLSSQPEEYQTALLLHSIGPDGVRIYNGMKFASDEDSKKCHLILEKLDSHFLGERKEFFERFKFNRRNQEGENIEQYVTVLRTMSKSCGFCECMKDKLLMDRLLLGVSDDSMREKMMGIPDLTLSKAIDICKAVEAASLQMKALKNEEVVYKVYKKVSTGASHYSKRPGKSSGKLKDATDPKRCKFCCKMHEMKKEKCPAWGRTCMACKQKNHFKGSEVCRASTIHCVDDDSSSSSGESISSVTVQNINAVDANNRPVFCKMLLNDTEVEFQVDCGATVSLLPQKYVVAHNDIRKEAVQLQMWNKSTVTAVGKCKIKTRNPVNNKKYVVDYVVVKENLTPLLSKKAAEKMNLITINYDNFEQIYVATSKDLAEYPDVFSSSKIGTLPGDPVHLYLDDNVKPSIRPARTIPESLKDTVKAELDELERKGVIDVITDPTDWVSQLSVATRKSGKVRLCLDPRPLNVALKREHFPLPVLDDILPSLTDASTFSVCDLRNGYLHCPLDEESSLLTTFATPWGRYKWKRLPFGLKASSEIFQRRLHQALDGLDGVRCVADDIIIWGSSEREHDDRLESLLKRCQELGIVLNAEKCQFKVTELTFLGHVVSNRGMKVDPSKVKAIREMDPPKCRDDVHRLRGMVNYLSRYLPHLTEVLQPINDLTHKDVAWTWDEIHEQSFKKVKELLTQAPLLKYYDQKKPLVIHADASAHGIGAAMMQDGQPVAYASRALSDAESRYAVIEKEMLAIVFALEKWHQFTFAREVTVYSDHKPLECIVKKPLDRAPKRLQGMLLRAMAYNIEVKYLKGKENHLADPLSRSCLPYEGGQEEFEVVNSITHLMLPDDRVQEIRRHTAADETLRMLKDTILEGWPDHKSQLSLQLTPYFNIRDELTVSDGVIFRGERLVIPKQMRAEIKHDLHVGHSGIEGTLRRARELVYWPRMNQEISEYIQTCETCQEHSISQAALPLMSHEIPDRPWEKIGMDLFHYDGDTYLITVCYHSNFWEIDKLYKSTATSVINKLKVHFGRYGIPDIIISDNGPPFSSREFGTFIKEWGITYNPISPYNSKSNGKVESAVKSAKKMMKKCKQTGDSRNLALLNIRNTPTQGMDSSPAQRFLGRRTKTLTPTMRPLLQPRGSSKNEMKQMKLIQAKQAKYYNRRTKELPVLEDGDTVRMKPFQPGRDIWQKAKVLQKLDERSYEVISGGHTYRRNREHLRATRESPDSEISIPTLPDIETDVNDDAARSRPDDTKDLQPAALPDQPQTSSRLHDQEPTELRRSSRRRHEPSSMKDFVRY